jgi:HSP20 family protein
MSLFPRFSSHNDASLHPLFRFLEDPAIHEQISTTSGRRSTQHIFQPNFDVHETPDAYILDGELPGVSDKSKIDIEFIDSQTLVVKGHVERSYSSRPTAADDDDNGQNKTSTAPAAAAADKDKKSLQPRVEEDAGNDTTTTVATSTAHKNDVAVGKNHKGRKMWVSERVFGEYQRSFSFPMGIDQDAVKASLNHGILNIVIPKKVQKGSRKIAVE